MTEQQQHLQSAIQQQNTLLNEIQNLQQQIDSKRQLAVKAQGIIEYLDQIGIKLPEAEEDAKTETRNRGRSSGSSGAAAATS